MNDTSASSLLRKSLVWGVWKGPGSRFFAGRARPSRNEPPGSPRSFLLQYLSEDGRTEIGRVYCGSLEEADVAMALILDAEAHGPVERG